MDIETGLHWMRCALGQTWDGKNCSGAASNYNWNAAHEAVAALNHDGGYAGYCDWRLPSIDELKTLVYCSSGQPKTWNDTGESCKGEFNRPTIDLTAFPDTPSSWFWSGSPNASNCGQRVGRGFQQWQRQLQRSERTAATFALSAADSDFDLFDSLMIKTPHNNEAFLLAAPLLKFL